MKRLFIIMCLMIVSVPLMAQNADAVPEKNVFGVAKDAEGLFVGLLPEKDSSFTMKVDHRDTFWKRVSLHFNILDWALTLPSIGVEFDLGKTEKNNRSIMVVGKWNPNTKHNFNPQVVFNVQAARVEFRKYWRTGSMGKRIDHQYQKINLKRLKPLTRDSIFENETTHEMDTIQMEYYATAADSARAAQYNGDPNRGWLYNQYHRFRRNVTSGRTLRHPRNWRAYYLGAYAGVDKWNLCFNKQGKRGSGIYLGATLGWSIPLLTRQFPSEGGLDLDIGALVGLKAVRYDAYHYEDESGCYAKDVAASKPSWTLVKYPVVQELRLSLVYRFRSVSRKVSLAIIDDYDKKWVQPFETRKSDREMQLRDEKDSLKLAHDEGVRVAKLAADSASWADQWHGRRLKNALKINPDTIFVGKDDTLYNKIIRGINLKDKRQSKALQDSLRNADKKAAKEAKEAAKASAKQKKAEAKKATAKQKATATIEAAATLEKEGGSDD